jgi:hypothetical protein
MLEIIEECEKGLKVNADMISNCITDFSIVSKMHNDEVAMHIDRLSKVIISYNDFFLGC